MGTGLPMTSAVETKWWHTEGDRIVCTLCPRHCRIHEGKRGFCFVRANVDGNLELTTYGRSSGFCIDPIEKKPLNHFLPGTPILSFGTAGCNLGCKFCQNWDISKSREMDRLADEATPEAIIAAAKQAGCRSVAYTYNDPIIWAEYAIAISKVARAEGIKTVAVTAGYISPEARGEFFDAIDAANVDLKAFTEHFYYKLTLSHLEPVLDTLKYLKRETDVWFELTNLMIPEENDDEDETKKMCGWIVDHLGDAVPVHFTAFHPDFKMRDKPRTPAGTLVRARQIALDAGIKYAYVGNVNDLENQSTYCPGCGQMLIERDWYELGRYRLRGNQCDNCGQVVPGVFEEGRGDWGRKRLPVTINQSAEQVTVNSRPIGPRNANSAQAGANASQGAVHTSSGVIAADTQLHEVSVMPGSTPSKTTRTPIVNVSPQAAASSNTEASSPHDADDAATNEPAEPRIHFGDDEKAAMLTYARAIVDAAVRRDPPPDPLPPALANAPAYGLFVTLRRSSQLRGCRGRWGGQALATLGELITNVAADTARLDERFPSVTAEELPRLAIDLSVMFDPQPVTATGEDRIGAVEVGRHGLVIRHPDGRGLLLPQVAAEANWDAKSFLDGVCRKAALREDAWRRDDQTQLMTFEARLLTAEPPSPEINPLSLNGNRHQALIDAANRMLRDQPAEATSGGEDGDMLTRQYEEELGMCVYTESGQSSTAIGCGHSLLKLTRMAVNSLRELCAIKNAEPAPITRITLLWQPILLRPSNYPARHRTLGRHAVLARHGQGWSLVVPNPNETIDRVAGALRNLNITPAQWQQSNSRVTAFSAMSFGQRRRPAGENVRQAARAGQFYPGDTAAMLDAIDRHLEVGRREAENAAKTNGDDGAKPRRAVMLPHAGWMFCGDTIGKTLARTAVPDTAIIIGPKHTPYGHDWSVAPHRLWDIPGASVPIAGDLAGELCDKVPPMQAEAQAHRMEHGAEVLIPFLHRINPNITVLPIVIGRADYESTEVLATALAELYAAAADKPLLVISSDMNHFAPEPENRRRDYMAIDAMCTGDPRNLYDTCVQNDISMCGFIPACIIMQVLLKLSPTLEPELVDYCNSAKATGDTSRVVGYAGVLLD